MSRLFCFALLCFVFRLHAFVEAVALRSIVLRYAGAPAATRVFSFWRCRFFRVFLVPCPLSLCMESTSYVLFFRIMFFYIVTTDWSFDISLRESSTNQSINQSINLLYAPCSVFFFFLQMNVPHFFVSPLLGIESQKCVTSYSTGTVAQWPSRNFYNPLRVSSNPPASFLLRA